MRCLMKPPARNRCRVRVALRPDSAKSRSSSRPSSVQPLLPCGSSHSKDEPGNINANHKSELNPEC